MNSLGTKRFLVVKRLKFANGVYVVAQAYNKLEDIEFIDDNGEIWKILIVSKDVWDRLCTTGTSVARQGNRKIVLTLPTRQDSK